MRGDLRRWAGGKAIRAAAAVAILIGAAGTASAGDGNFFEQLFGGQNAAPAQPQYAPAPVYDGGGGDRLIRRPDRRASRPLTVRLHRPKVAHVAQAPSKPGKVSIYEDTTLRRGDAVMTIKGMRIFAGSRSWPYSERDFVAVADAGRLDKGLQKTLLALDSLPPR
ncbi:MAG TPA: hypothetical protein VH414_14165 [Lichenihabitans sp.]|jgi:hypothetical protein|nr:hypothetical protein [Lichenihabitans sp.]